MSNRDDFSKETKIKLAKRVGYLCSKPDCRRLTIGPDQAGDGVVSIGIACHIYAAAPNGPRANNELSSDERSSIDNGIWLCSNCSALIDKDPDAYPPDLLLRWKQDAEQKARKQLENTPTQLYIHEEKNKSINYSLIDKAISKVIRNRKLIDFLIYHDFSQPYYKPLIDELFDLLDIIKAHRDIGSPYDNLLLAIYEFRKYLATNAFWYNQYGYFLLGPNRDPEVPHNLAILVAEELRKI